MKPVAELTKDFVRVAKRLAARARKNGIVPPIVAVGRGRIEASDGFVVVSVPADHDSPVAGFDPSKLKATHGATVERAGDVHQREESVAEVAEVKAWPDYGETLPKGHGLSAPFHVEPQLLLDALDAMPRDGQAVEVRLPTLPGVPVLILHPSGAQALVMPQQDAPSV